MSKFNPSTGKSTKTKNHEGGPAYTMPKEVELFSSVVTTFLEDKFYEDANTRMQRIKELCKECDPEFVGKVAVWAREKGNMRSAPIYVAALLAGMHNGDSLVRRVTSRVINRADEITEMLAAYQQLNGKDCSFSRQLVKGVADAFNKFDEYQFSKYNREGAWKLRDALFLAHPKAKNKEQSTLFDKIAKDELETAKTWETELTKAGEDGKGRTLEEKEELKKESWEEMIDSGKLGYMAALRNLRNMLDCNVSAKHMKKVCAQLSAPENVLKSRQLPFRFLSAYKELEGYSRSPNTKMVLSALESAMVASAGSIRGFDENVSVCVATDFSGSMDSNISDKSSIRYWEVGLVLSMLLNSRCKSVINCIFGETMKVVNFSDSSSILGNCAALSRDHDAGIVGHSTNGFLIPHYLTQEKIMVDKVMMFTDCEMWNSYGGNSSLASTWAEYKKINPGCKLYLFNLAGHGTTPVSINSQGVYNIAGWSEKVFELMDYLDNGEALVKIIGQIDL